MELQSVCDNLVDESDGLVACMLLDLETGLTLAYAGRHGFDAAAAERIMRAAGTMFRGQLVEQFARSLPKPKPVGGFVREVQITTTNTYHFMSTLPGWPNTLLIFVTDKSLSIGLGWMAVHQAFDRLLRAEPDSPAAGSARPSETPPPRAAESAAAPAAAAPIAPSVETAAPPARADVGDGVAQSARGRSAGCPVRALGAAARPAAPRGPGASPDRTTRRRAAPRAPGPKCRARPRATGCLPPGSRGGAGPASRGGGRRSEGGEGGESGCPRGVRLQSQTVTGVFGPAPARSGTKRIQRVLCSTKAATRRPGRETSHWKAEVML